MVFTTFGAPIAPKISTERRPFLMSYAQGTTHYNLPQTVGTDKRDWFDTNQAFRDVDEALWGAKESAEGAASQVTTLGQRVSDVEDDVADVKQDVTALEGDVSGLQSAVTNLGTEVSGVKTDLMDAICAVVESSATASVFHHRGSYFWYNDTLYKATVDINVGAQIVPNVNCNTVTVATEFYKGLVEVQTTSTMTYAQALYQLRQRIDANKITGDSVLVFEQDSASSEFWVLRPVQHQNGIYDFGAVQYGCMLMSMRMHEASDSNFIQVQFGSSSFIRTDRSAETIGSGKRVLLIY